MSIRLFFINTLFITKFVCFRIFLSDAILTKAITGFDQ